MPRTWPHDTDPAWNDPATVGRSRSVSPAATSTARSAPVSRSTRPTNNSNGSPSTRSHTPDPARRPARATASAMARSAAPNAANNADKSAADGATPSAVAAGGAPSLASADGATRSAVAACGAPSLASADAPTLPLSEYVFDIPTTVPDPYDSRAQTQASLGTTEETSRGR